MVRAVLRARSLEELRTAVTVTRAGDHWTIRIQRLLTNFNAGNRSGHWSGKHRERQRWQSLISNGIVAAVGYRAALEVLGPKSGLPGAKGECLVPMRVVITRLVGSRRRFVRDEFDNLRWCTKELRDALTQLALLKDDSSAWCEMAIGQAVSPDGTAWTEITIEPSTSLVAPRRRRPRPSPVEARP